MHRLPCLLGSFACHAHMAALGHQARAAETAWLRSASELSSRLCSSIHARGGKEKRDTLGCAVVRFFVAYCQSGSSPLLVEPSPFRVNHATIKLSRLLPCQARRIANETAAHHRGSLRRRRCARSPISFPPPHVARKQQRRLTPPPPPDQHGQVGHLGSATMMATLIAIWITTCISALLAACLQLDCTLVATWGIV